MTFDDFRAKYPARAPNKDKIKNDDELLLMPIEKGRGSFDKDSGASAKITGIPRDIHDIDNAYLWVIAKNDVPFALKDECWGKELETGEVKHTNLTGGEDAHCGGELWFVSQDAVIVNGSSGRYGPKHEQELQDAANSFAASKYKVANIGFDEDTGFPLTILVGEPQWIS